MSPHPRTVSAQITVEELARVTPCPDHAVFAVVDQRGRAVGVLHWDDVIRIPHVERPARLVGDVIQGPIVMKNEALAEALGRPAVARATTAVVVDNARQPVGLLDVRDASRPLADRGTVVPEMTGSWTVVPSDGPGHASVGQERHGTASSV
jgi:CBS domain containing-hemolysin-like protein